MRVNYLKSGAVLLSLQLVMCPLQAQSVDADCARVAAAARDATVREIARIDTAEQEIARAIDRSKSCADSVIRDLNRAIPSFGGGLIDSIASALLANLAKSACQLIGRTQEQVMSSVPPVPTVSSLPIPPIATGQSGQAPTAAFGGGSTSIWDRLGRVN